MTFKKAEKEFLKSIVKYGDDAESLADAINKSHLLEKRGWNIVVTGAKYYLFYRQDRYDYEEEQKVRGELAELLTLLDKLYNERLLIAFPSSHNNPLVIGKQNVIFSSLNSYSVDNGKEFIVLSQFGFGWYSKNNESVYGWDDCTEMIKPFERVFFSAYHVSQDLVDLVKNDFKSEEEIRFCKQQWLMWISIFVALVVGLLGIFCK